jgi:hypothetical protein
MLASDADCDPSTAAPLPTSLQRIATMVADEWMTTSEANRVAAAESILRLAKDALQSLRSFDAAFMSDPKHLIQEFK